MKRSNLFLGFWYAVAVAFLFAPIVVSIVYSFNLGSLGKQTSTFTGWTVQWFADAWSNNSLRQSAETSLHASFWASVIAVVLGTCLGMALVRHPSRAIRRVLSFLAFSLLVIPETVIGVSLLLFYAETGFRLGLMTLVFGISPLAIAVTALIVRASMLTLDRSLEEAASDLGANSWQVVRDIVLPHLAPAVVVSALIAYVFSFDNLVISSFLTTPVVNTLPVYLFGSLQYGPSPAVYAAATSVFGLTILLIALAGFIYFSKLRHTQSRFE
jgi:ABC-type spermidine/putrescine transport system permease subunit II